jgi:hypothetical protein
MRWRRVDVVGLILGVAAFLAAGWGMGVEAGQAKPQGAGSGKSQVELRKLVVGTWRLISMEGGPPASIEARGPKPTGLIMYDANGYMAAQIMPDRARPKYTGVPDPKVAYDMMRGYTAYWGTYTIDEKTKTITHHRQGMLDGGVVDYIRTFELLPPDRIVLTTVNTSNLPIRLVWERVK